MKFLLDTDSVSSIGSGITKISTSASSIADECNGYSVDCSEFDFAGAKSTIVANVRSMTERIRNTSAIIEGTVAAHSGIQAYTFDQYLNPPKENENDKSSTAGGNPRSRRSSSGSRSSGSRSSNPRSTYKDQEETLVTGITEEKPKETEPETIKKISYAKVDKGNLSDESKKVLKTAASKNGYILIKGRYALACSPAIGKVGDVIKFTGRDGKEVECVVTINTVADNNKNKAYFLVDGEGKDIKPLDCADMFTNKDTKIENLGDYTKYNTIQTVTEESTGVGTATGSVTTPDPATNTQETSTDTVTQDVNSETPNTDASTEEKVDENTTTEDSTTEGGLINA